MATLYSAIAAAGLAATSLDLLRGIEEGYVRLVEALFSNRTM
jgi:hypothetical protein